MTPPATSQKSASAERATTISLIARRQTQPIPIYKTEENHLGQVIQSAFIIVPAMAIPHTILNINHPRLAFNTIRQTGVYDPAIRKKIIM